LRRDLIVTAAAFLIAATVQLPAQTIVEETGDLINAVRITGAYLDVDGDTGRFLDRHGTGEPVYGGIEDFRYETYLGDAVLTIEGHGLAGQADYRFQVELNHWEKGYIQAGFHQFRTWHDGSGGFFPPSGVLLSEFEEALALDRGEAWFEGAKFFENGAILRLRYTHKFREGQKDSTIWGDSLLTSGLGDRGIAPALLDIDEESDVLEGDFEKTTGSTDWGVGVRYEIQESSNARHNVRQPGETLERRFTQREACDSNLFNVRGFTHTRWGEKVFLSSAASYTHLEMNFSGSRVYGSTFDPVFDPNFRRQINDNGFVDLTGNAGMKQFLLNLNCMVTPFKNITVVSAVRLEKLDLDSQSEFDEANFPAFQGGALAPSKSASSENRLE
jgi:hypothetical protein